MTTKIEWCKSPDGTRGHTWNLFTGCTHKSDGCDHCYAARIAGGRLKNHRNYKGLTLDGKWTGEVRFNHHEIDKPRHWKKSRMIFVNSMSDTFHDAVKTWWIDEMMGVIKDCPQHTFQILTKRSDNIIEKLDCWNGKLPENVWLGVTVESDKYLSRIDGLLKVQAAVHFVSIEPCLGPVDIKLWLGWTGKNSGLPEPLLSALEALPDIKGLDWVICGGESGHGARPMHPSWPRDLRDQCVKAGVPFFFKQKGEWQHDSDYIKSEQYKEWANNEGFGKCLTEAPGFTYIHRWADKSCSFKIGKKDAGRLLDGREWNELPGKINTEGTESTESTEEKGG